ncbi:MAG: chitobiase/beta-hexosaminidase C-terminal domain-containing protein [Bacteroidaceae bacterium]|nr:chitobiase/beta-hexosaminidase C-terminal domain-containing protein [Bacteroidaceae bacterium]
MKKIQLFIMLLILAVPLPGAVKTKYEYWFDNDRTSVVSGIVDSTSLDLLIETGLLESGMHTIHVMLTDTNGAPVPVITRHFIKAFNADEMKEVVFWIDNDTSAIKRQNSIDGIIEIGTDKMDYGFHYVHAQVIGNSGTPTSVSSAYFIKAFYTTQLKEVSYWFDNDRSDNRKLDITDDIIELNTDDIDYGFHFVHIQVVDSTGIATSVSTKSFIKTFSSTKIKDICYWFDNDESTIHSLKTYDDIIEIPADSLLNGFHSIHVRITDDFGSPTSVATSFFIKMDTDIDQFRMFYSVDNGKSIEITNDITDGVCYLDLDMSNLTDGLHRLVYYLANENEVTTSIRTCIFWKNPIDEAPVLEYSYWLNDDGDTTVVQNTDYSDPLIMDVMVPVESVPFRSTYFSFLVEDGKPVAYAKNDFHINVKNYFGYTDEEMASYTDMNVSYPIENLIHLEPNDVKTSAVPGENKILWFKFDVAQNDSVTLRLDAEATMQLFSPTGQELINVNDTNALHYNASWVHENGTCYVAVHDVTAAVNDITIEYNRTDAYGLPHVMSLTCSDSINIVLGNVVNLYDVVTLLPLESRNRLLTVSSDNELIAKIVDGGDGKLEIVGASAGITNITVRSNDTPSTYKSIKIKVSEPDIKINYDGRFLSFDAVDGVIHYTLDGTEPSAQSPMFKNKIDVMGLCGVKAIAVNNGYESMPGHYTVDSYYDGAIATTSQKGVLAKAFGWCGTDGVENLRIEGTLDNSDFETIRTLVNLRLLDLSNAVIAGNELTDSLLSGSGVLSVKFPSTIEKVGNGLFYGCDNLASIVWSSTTVLTQDVFGGMDNPNFLLFVNDISQAVRTGITNIVVNGMAQRITLSDNILPDGTHGPANFYCPMSFRVQNEITYTHNYSQITLIGDCGGWETLSLPFDVQTITHSEKGEIVPFKLSASGRKQFWLCALTDNGFVDADSIQANKPYLIAMPNNPEYSPFYCLNGDVTFSSRNVVVPVSQPDTSYNGSSGFVPCFEQKGSSESIYALNVGEERWNFAAGSLFDRNYRSVYPFEAYRISTSHAVQRMPIANDINGNATSVLIPRADGVEILRYDLKGMPVDDNHKGLYIQDGKVWFRK